MTHYRPGTLLLMEFPFPLQRTVKRRPVLVVADVDPQDVIVIQVTSKRPRGRLGAISPADLREVRRAIGDLFR